MTWEPACLHQPRIIMAEAAKRQMKYEIALWRGIRESAMMKRESKPRNGEREKEAERKKERKKHERPPKEFGGDKRREGRHRYEAAQRQDDIPASQTMNQVWCPADEIFYTTTAPPLPPSYVHNIIPNTKLLL